MAALPMFPLGTVLFPGQPLSLHVFEPRYLTMIEHCLSASPEFGVVLIDRGSEVGGHDVRRDVGTVARITDVAELPAGVAGADRRLLLMAVGTRRIRVDRWLADDPHPWADVTDWPDGPTAPHGAAEPAAEFGPRSVAVQLRRVLALQSELGESVADATFDLLDDPVAASHQLCALAPVGVLDQQGLLAAATATDRLQALSALLADAAEVIELRLGAG